jgi:hypothetical protein
MGVDVVSVTFKICPRATHTNRRTADTESERLRKKWELLSMGSSLQEMWLRWEH